MFKVGQKILATKDCSGSYAGQTYELELHQDGVGFRLKGTYCNCGDGWQVGKEQNSKFKVGDRVRIIGNKTCQTYTAGKNVGYVGIITQVNLRELNSILGSGYYLVDGKDVWENDLELVTNEPSNSSENKVGVIMGNIKTFVKNSLLSKNEKLLRKYGFKNECGDYTQDAKDYAITLLCAEKEADMIKVAQGLADEEEKSK